MSVCNALSRGKEYEERGREGRGTSEQNVIAPGFIETEMTDALDGKVVDEWRKAIPLKRGGTPEDVANAALFLASDLSGYVTGQVISVCGGMLT